MENILVQIPANAENLSLPSPDLLTYYKNLQNRTIWLDTDITDECLELSRLIILWNAEDKGIPVEERVPIRLMICSYGGELDINNAIVSLIELSETPVYSYNMGYACSAGCFIAMACHKRYCLPGSYYLVHKGSAEFGGTADQVAAAMSEYARKINELANFILVHSRIPEDRLMEELGGEWYLSADEALELGVCDAIITNINEVV